MHKVQFLKAKFAWIYVCLSAVSIVMIDKFNISHHIPVAVLLMSGSLTAIVFFNCLTYTHIRKNHQVLFTDFKYYLRLTTYLCLCWIFTYLGTILSSANFLIFVLFLTSALLGSWDLKMRKYLISMVLLVGVLLNFKYGILAIAISILSGVFLFLYYNDSNIYAKKNNLSSLDIMAIRFYPLFFLSTIFVIIYHEKISFSVIPFIVLLGFLNMVIPSYYAQRSVITEGVSTYTSVAVMMPILTSILQMIICAEINLQMLILSILASLVLLIRK